jgi:hypothetical protein
MSDTQQGVGWWLASDGKWYPPEQAPGATAPPPPSQPIAVQLQKPKKKLTRRPLFWILLVILVFIGGCSAIVVGAGTAVDHAAHEQHSVTYSVTGNGTATNITYATVQEGNGQNGESQVSNAPLPWSKTITASGLFTDFVVSGTVGANGGTVTCSITEDGKQLNTNTASGAFATATCNATGKS